jgi:voltage-gated potassium channel
VKHRNALITITTAAGLDMLGGLAFAAVEHLPAATGLYWAVTTATTVGYGDVAPHSPGGRLIAVLVMLTVIPLFGATFSLFTSGMTAGHIRSAEDRIKAHVEDRLKHHLGPPDE